MFPGKYQIRWSIVFLVTLIVAGLFFWETKNLKKVFTAFNFLETVFGVYLSANRVSRKASMTS